MRIDPKTVAGLPLLLVLGLAGAQTPQAIEGRPVTGSSPPSRVTIITPAPNSEAEKERRRKQEDKLQADAARLVVLTNELEEEIKHRTPGVLSSNSVKHADEIEKLARGVKKSLTN